MSKLKRTSTLCVSLVLLVLTAMAGAQTPEATGSGEWQTSRNLKYGYEIRFPANFEAWPTGPKGERDGRTIRIARKEFAAAAPVLDIRIRAENDMARSRSDFESPELKLTREQLVINHAPAVQITGRWSVNDEVAFVDLFIGKALIEFQAPPGLHSIDDTVWWEIISTFRLLEN
jgi:hypothetical protein